jgi:endonuclease/exonuclease/phosphatase family metal-dependent hydrolase
MRRGHSCIMRIATWNLERPEAQSQEKLAAIQQQLRLINADIWVLTETNSCVSPGDDYQCLESPPLSSLGRYSPGENRTTIWSRFPITRCIPAHDPETAVCAELDHGGTPLLVYGTIIPYGAAGINYRYRYNGETVVGKKAWQLHYESIQAHGARWKELRREYPAHSLCVAGDLNQNRDGRRWYGTKHGREQLGPALAGANLVCVSARPLKSAEGDVLQPTVDHICLDHNLTARITSVRGWAPGAMPDGCPVSDHRGVYVDVM